MSPEQDPRDDEERPQGADFGRLLAEFESGREAGTPRIGAKVRGRVVQIGAETCFVDFGGRSEGAMDLQPFLAPDGTLRLQVGDELELFVVEDRDQVILAPSMRAEPAAALSQVIEARRAGMPVTGRIRGMNAGGLEVDIAGLRGFCPVSQIDAGFCPDPSVYLGRTLEFLVTEVSEGGKRLVVSRKALLHREEEDRRRALLSRLREGQELDGTVSRLESYGAFVDLGGVDGLVHVSEISHARIESPAEALTVGQSVRVKVLGMKEPEGGRPRISLSIKAAAPDPWQEVAETYWPGRVVEGTVARLTEFGAFVNLAPGIDGLVHVSEIDLKPVAHPKDVLQTGQRVRAKILSLDAGRRRISLSIRDLLASAGAIGDGADTSALGGARSPAAGEIADAWVAGIKPYGLFVDLPAFGHRTRALVPHEETGERRGTDLAKRYRIGDQVRVEITDVDGEGKIRASMIRVQERSSEEQFRAYQAAGGGPASPQTTMAEALRRAMEEAEKRKPR